MKDFLIAMAILTCTLMLGYMVGRRHDSSTVRTQSTSTEAEQGRVEQGKDALTYYITIGTSVRAYVDGVGVSVSELQEAIEVNGDGVLGPVTINQMLDWNRLEVK